MLVEAEKRTHWVCFTGHRHEKLSRCEKAIRKDLEMQIRQANALKWVGRLNDIPAFAERVQ